MRVQDHPCLHSNLEAHSASCDGSCGSGCGCEPENGANDSSSLHSTTRSRNQPQDVLVDVSTPHCKAVKSSGKVPSRPDGIIPLPGLLDHHEFVRTTVQLGRCGICDQGAAVFRCKEKQVNICEGCYARLIREWNQANGIC